ncbi:hypothetical protein Mapa_002226 [Marchantia paleacea]|nr:hypothetical protein Mapa_002226 [Marchantia paleacea]
MNLTRSISCNAVVIALVILSTVIVIWGTGQVRLDEGPLRSTIGSIDHTKRLLQQRLDAIFVLTGGQTDDGGVPLWVARRLDRAVELQRSQSEPVPPIVCVGGGSGVVPPILTPEKFVMHESTSAAKYLHEKWKVSFSLLLKEWSSYDTEGNAYFALTQHAIPAGWRHIAIVTSEFHMPRSEAVFEWIFGLEGAGAGAGHSLSHATDPSKHDSSSQGFWLEYISVSDEGLDAKALKTRVAAEKRRVKRINGLAQRIHTLPQFHHYLFVENRIYNTAKQHLFGKEGANMTTAGGLY